MKRIVTIVASLLITLALTNAQTKDTDKMFKEFQSTEWTDVLKAKENLENTQAGCIPGLISLLDENGVKKLVNSGDLIYPGAERFFGHGQIIDYDIDKVNVRAGWLLEELTFQNFGFTGIHISPEELTDYIKFNFPKYYNNAKNRQLIDKSTDKEKRDLIRDLSIEEAKRWWASEGDEWNRLDAIVNALKSDDEKRQAKALFYIRNGKTACSGLTIEVYKARIEPVVKELSKSPLKRISEQAKLIMLDTSFEWMKLKAVS
ncbi:MAG: hypothetical protein JXB00_04855 [Bacteroidales bacterium]|nr:hypothetical protein [Bacteroidales bacterium]